MVAAGAVKPLIRALSGGKLSPVAMQHAAQVLSGLAPLGTNALAIKDAGGITPLVELLRGGNVEAKEQSANALAQLALRAGAAIDIAEAGAVSAFVAWLVDPALGPPAVAARALSEIADQSPDAQAQIAEEGAIPPLVDMLSAGASAISASRSAPRSRGRRRAAAAAAVAAAAAAAAAVAQWRSGATGRSCRWRRCSRHSASPTRRRAPSRHSQRPTLSTRSS